MERVYEHPHPIRSEGREYRVTVLGEQRSDKTWAGWIEFVPLRGGERLRTEQETSQPDRKALEYWATGLEDLYFDGALERAAAVTQV